MITRRSLSVAIPLGCLVFVLEVFVLDGWGLALFSFAVPLSVIISGQGGHSASILIRDKRNLLLLGSWILLFLAIMVARLANDRIAEREGRRSAAACEAYKRSVGRYPAHLADLVPDYLPAVPGGKLAVGSHWEYVPATQQSDRGPRLCLRSFAFYHSSCYDFATKSLKDGPSW